MRKRSLGEEVEEIKKNQIEDRIWREKMDLCLHTARILMGLLWATIVAVFTAISANWETIKHYMPWASK